LDNTAIPYPHQTSPYTIVEPMRVADFMDLQYQAAASLTETNKKINDLLDDSMIADIKQSIINVRALTAQATTTLAKAEKLIDESRGDLENMMAMANQITDDFSELSGNVNNIIGDPEFKPTLMNTTKSIGDLCKELTPILGSVNSKKFTDDLSTTMANVSEITTSVNKMTKDTKLKSKLNCTVDNLNKALYNVSTTLETVNNTNNKGNVKEIMEDTATTVHNLRKFSDKLNKRFLLFRLIF